MSAAPPPLDGRVAILAGWGRSTAVASVLMRELGIEVLRLRSGHDDDALARFAGRFHGSAVQVVEPDQLAARLTDADFLVHQRDRRDLEQLGLGPERQAALNPDLVVCEVTGFPPGGEWSGRPASGRAAEAVAGLMRVTFPFDGDGPVYTPRPLAAYGSALLIVGGLQLGLELARREGRGARVAVSEVDGSLLPQVLNAVYAIDPAAAPPPERDPDPLQVNTPTIRCYEAADGWMLMAAPSTDAWARAGIAMGRADLVIDERFGGAPWALADPVARAALIEEVAATLRQQSIEHWQLAFGAVNVPCAPVLDTAGFRRLPHLEESGAVRGAGKTLEASMWKFDQRGETGAASARPAGREPAATPELPLAGLKVVELATFAAGPFAGAVLADNGAEVLKLEQPPGGDPYREQGYTFAQLNRGKSSRALDLRDPGNRAELEGLLADADVLLVNMRRSGLEKLAIDFDSVAAINPRIVYCWLTAWGSGGSLENGPGVDPIFQAISGQARSNGGHSGALRMIPSGLLDNYTGMLAASGILAALERRRQRGGAQYVETALVRGAILAQLDDFLGLGEARDLGRDPVGLRALDRIYRAADEWLYLCVEDAAGWEALCTLLGRPEWRQEPGALDADYDSELSAALAASFAERPRAGWLRLLAELPPGAIAVPVLDPAELVEDASVPGQELFTEVDDVQWGALWQLRPLIDVGGVKQRPLTTAPRLNSGIPDTTDRPVDYRPPIR